MLSRTIGLRSVILRRPRTVLGASALLVLLAAALGTRVEFRTSRSDLAPQDDPDQRRWTALLQEYAGSEALIACVEAAPGTAPDAAPRRRFASEFARVVAADPRVAHVFHRVDVDWFLDHGLWLAAPESLAAAAAALGAEPALFGALEEVRGLPALNERLAARIERGLVEGATLPAPADGGATPEALLAGFLAAEVRFLEDPSGAVEAWTAVPPQAALAALGRRDPADGFLETFDGVTTFVVITQRGSDDRLEHRRELVAAMRAHAAAVGRGLPGYRVSFTGQPAMVVDEMTAVRADTFRTSLLAAAGVALLTFLVFRWRSHALLVLTALAVGVTWAFGAVWLELGYLNLITSSFISTLVGVGVAYGIHPVSEYELCGAHTGDPLAAVDEAYRRTGAGITVAAVTTSAAFFSILLMRFRGFAELGVVAGVGVLLCLLAALTTLPALLVLYGRWRCERPSRSPAPGRVVDRLWFEAVAGRVTRFPRVTGVAALVITAVAGWAAAGLRFDANILDLLPRDAESVRYQRRIMLESDLSPLYNIVAAPDLAGLQALAERAAGEPLVARFESVLRFLPRDREAAARALEALSTRVDALRLAGRTDPLDPARLARSLERLEAALAEAGEAAFGAGLADLAGPLESARADAERALDLARDADPSRVAAWDGGQQRLLAWAGEGLAWLKRAAHAEAPTVASLPPEVRQRFVTEGGRLLGFLYPAIDVFDPAPLAAYVAASVRVSPEATGFPLVFNKMSGRIVAGFNRAVAAGALIVLAILVLDFRNLRNATLAMVPLLMGTVWMLGAMRLLGLSFNLANLVAVPLIIGVGIDNGVHVIHRVVLEGRQGMTIVLQHTGRAILIASLTTMIGFGSLSLATHRGLSSLGLVLLLGVGACLVTSTIVLPNLLVVSGRVRR